MIPTFADPGEVAPGQFGPISRAPAPRTTSTAGTMSRAGMPSVMQKIVAIPAAAASITASGAPAAGTKMQEVFAPVSRTASATVSKTGTVPSSAGLAALAGRHPGDDRRAVRLHRPAVELALATGDPWTSRRVSGPTRMLMRPLPGMPRRPWPPPRRATAAVVKCACSRSVAASAALVPTMRTTIGTSRVWAARASIRPRATSSPRVIPPKMLTRIGFHLRVGEDDPHRRCDPDRPRPAADVEEVRRFAAGPLDQVHRGHRQAGTIDHAADLAVELDEGHARLARLAIGGLLLVRVAQRLQLRVAGERRVIEGHLGVEADQPLDRGAGRRRVSRTIASGLISTRSAS